VGLYSGNELGRVGMGEEEKRVHWDMFYMKTSLIFDAHT
jgi:hypothetical protein